MDLSLARSFATTRFIIIIIKSPAMSETVNRRLGMFCRSPASEDSNYVPLLIPLFAYQVSFAFNQAIWCISLHCSCERFHDPLDTSLSVRVTTKLAMMHWCLSEATRVESPSRFKSETIRNDEKCEFHLTRRRTQKHEIFWSKEQQTERTSEKEVENGCAGDFSAVDVE